MHKNCVRLLTIVFLIFAFSGAAFADEILLYPVADSYINQADAYAINGSKTSLISSYEGQGTANIALIKFDLTKIPKGSIIYSAAFQLTTYACSGADQFPELNLNSAIDSWKEETVRWAGKPSFGNDSNIIKPEVKTLAWLVKNKVQKWLDTPDSNLGFSVSVQGGPYTCKFYSREYSTVSARPALIVKYTPPPSPTPSPTKLLIGKLIVSPVKLNLGLLASPTVSPSPTSSQVASDISTSPTPEKNIVEAQNESENAPSPIEVSISPSPKEDDKKMQNEESFLIPKSQVIVIVLVSTIIILLGVVIVLVLRKKKEEIAPTVITKKEEL